MIKDLPPPTEAEEHRNTAEILRDLAVQTQFGKTRSELFNCAENLDRLAALPSPSINLKLGFKRFAHPLTSDPSRQRAADLAVRPCRRRPTLAPLLDHRLPRLRHQSPVLDRNGTTHQCGALRGRGAPRHSGAECGCAGRSADRIPHRRPSGGSKRDAAAPGAGSSRPGEGSRSIPDWLFEFK